MENTSSQDLLMEQLKFGTWNPIKPRKEKVLNQPMISMIVD
jgi:hypothetical protein